MTDLRTHRLEVSAGVLVTVFWLAVVAAVGFLEAAGRLPGTTLAALSALCVLQAALVRAPEGGKAAQKPELVR